MRSGHTFWVLGFWLTFATATQAQTREIPGREADAKAHPRDAASQTALGFAYMRAGRYRDAEHALEKAESLQKGSPVAVTRLAQLRIAEGDYKAARSLCKKLFAEADGAERAAPMAHVCMARTYLAWNRSERAFEELDQALVKDPELREADLVRGHAQRMHNEVAAAEASYARAKGDPALAGEAELGLGQLYMAAGRRDDAVAAFRRALANEPNSPDAELLLGQLLGSSEEARSLLAAALENRPGWSDAAVALGDARRDAHDFTGAEAAYREALKSDPQLAKAQAGLGEMLLLRGELDEAKTTLESSLKLVPNDARAALALAEVLVRKGLFEEAVEQFRHAADLDPKNPAALERAAEFLVAEKRMTLAAGFLDRLLSAHPGDGRGLALYGDVMAAQGDRAQAKQYYQRALSAGGVSDAAAIQTKLRGL